MLVHVVPACLSDDLSGLVSLLPLEVPYTAADSCSFLGDAHGMQKWILEFPSSLN